MDDFRAVFRVVGEVRELGADTEAWRRHAVVEVLRLVNAQVGLAHELPMRASAESLHQFLGMVEVGWPTERDARFFRQIMDRPMFDDPALTRYLTLLRPGSVTCRLDDLVEPRVWHRCEYFNEVRRPLGCDTFMNAGCVLPTAGCIIGMSINRAAGEKSFSIREREIVQLFHEEICLLWQHPAQRDPIDDLPPRLRQVVQGLRNGDSEKQIAYRLGLAKGTVHAYAKDLHKRFNVSSRFELLQKLAPSPLRFRPRLSVETLHANGELPC